jgi:hypothetical protein
MTRADLRQSYGLGWTYVALSLLRAVLAVLLGQVLVSLWFLGLAASAASRSPLGWHVLLAGLLLNLAASIWFVADFFARFGAPPVWALVGGSVLKLSDALWFGYFYRRRAMFGADRRWRWAERLLPVLAGPETYPPVPVVAVPRARVFGLSRGRAILLAVLAALALLIIYPFLWELLGHRF